MLLCYWDILTHFPLLEPVQVLQVSWTDDFLLIHNVRLDQQGLFTVCSVPLVSELMETCIDDVLKAPGIPAVMAAEEAGPSSSFAAPSTTGEDSLSLSGKVTLGSHRLFAFFEKSFSPH